MKACLRLDRPFIERVNGKGVAGKGSSLGLKEEEFSGQRWKDFRVKEKNLSAGGAKEEDL